MYLKVWLVSRLGRLFDIDIEGLESMSEQIDKGCSAGEAGHYTVPADLGMRILCQTGEHLMLWWNKGTTDTGFKKKYSATKENSIFCISTNNFYASMNAFFKISMSKQPVLGWKNYNTLVFY